MTWLEGFEQKAASAAGGTFDGAPWRLVLHTTEGDSIEGAIAAFAATGSWPHFTVDPGRSRKIQHYPLSTSARALAHPTGTPETNRAGAIQVEIVGHAAESPDWPAAELDWLALEVVAPIRAARLFPLEHPTFVGPEAGTIASVHAPQRLTWDEWATYSGIVGHQHVPGNDHWDPGRLDVDRIVATFATPPPPVQEDDMPAPLVMLPIDKNFDLPDGTKLGAMAGAVVAIPANGARPWHIPSNDAKAILRVARAIGDDPEQPLTEPRQVAAVLAMLDRTT